MTAAIYQKANLATNAYNETLSYDKNGNIMHLNRTGHYDTSIGMAFSIDDLSYNYKPSSNILDFVSDQTNSTVGFRDGPIPGTDYNYDLNTNLIADNNKKIEKISYNHLNLPTKIKFSLAGQNEINYLYNALGVKRIKTVESTNAFGIPLTNQTNYVDGFQYLNNELQFFPTAEGYVSVSNGDNYNYVYNYTDHLGNIRISYSKEGTELKILEENHYYPFGLKHSYNIDTREYSVKEANSIATIIFVDRSNYQYKYQGQERQDELGLNWDSFKWRNYDYAIGRFMCIDPLAEKYPYNSTYAFQENKMGMGVELEGLELVPRDSTAGFGNYVKGKFDSAVYSIQTTTAKAIQAVSNAISSLEINQVDGYSFTGSKSGISDSTGFFPEAKGAKSSANLDGDVIVGLADAYSPDLGGNKIMDGANIFSNLVQTFGNPIQGANTVVSDNSTSSANTKPTAKAKDTTFTVSNNSLYSVPHGNSGYSQSTNNRTKTVTTPNNSKSVDSANNVAAQREKQLSKEVNESIKALR